MPFQAEVKAEAVQAAAAPLVRLPSDVLDGLVACPVQGACPTAPAVPPLLVSLAVRHDSSGVTFAFLT